MGHPVGDRIFLNRTKMPLRTSPDFVIIQQQNQTTHPKQTKQTTGQQ